MGSRHRARISCNCRFPLAAVSLLSAGFHCIVLLAFVFPVFDGVILHSTLASSIFSTVLVDFFKLQGDFLTFVRVLVAQSAVGQYGAFLWSIFDLTSSISL